MVWLIFPLLAGVGVAVGFVLPPAAVVGYAAVLGWVALMLYLVFYREDPVSRGLEDLSAEGGPSAE